MVTDTVRTEQISSRDRSFPVVRVRALDLQTGDTQFEFEFGGIGVYPQQFALGRTEILVGTERLITAVDFGTGVWRHIFEAPPGGIITRFALSHDAKTLAVGVEKKPIDTSSTEVVFVDFQSARELSRLAAVESFPGFRGGPSPLVWHADNRMLEVVGRTYQDNPGDFAAITKDGSIVRHAQALALDSGGRRAALVLGDAIGYCGGLGLAFPDGLDVVDLATQRSVGTVSIPGMVVFSAVFSPDGSEIFIGAVGLGSFQGRPCADSGPPQFYRWDSVSQIPLVADRSDIFKSWEGAQFSEIYCGGKSWPRF